MNTVKILKLNGMIQRTLAVVTLPTKEKVAESVQLWLEANQDDEQVREIELFGGERDGATVSVDEKTGEFSAYVFGDNGMLDFETESVLLF